MQFEERDTDHRSYWHRSQTYPTLINPSNDNSGVKDALNNPEEFFFNF